MVVDLFPCDARIVLLPMHPQLFLRAGIGLLTGACSVLAWSATLAVCPRDAASSESQPGQQLLAESPTESWVLSWRSDNPSPTPGACAELQLPVDASAVRWNTLLAPEDPVLAAKALALQGTARGPAVDVSEIFSLPLKPTPTAVPLMAPPAAPDLAWRAFGREERAGVEPAGRLVCAPGQAPAGFTTRLPEGSSRDRNVLRVVARGQGAFQVGLSDPKRLAQEAPLMLGTLAANKAWHVHEFALSEQRADWTAASLACPDTAAALEIQSLSLHSGRQQRAAWLWSPTLWQSTPEKIWAWTAAHNLNTVMVTVPVANGQVADAPALRRFLSEATRRQVAVWAVAGDPRDVLPASQPALRERLAAYRDFNHAAGADMQLAGVQLDIEPYLLPGYRLNPKAWRDAYLATVRAAREQLGPDLPLDMVVPVWWGTDRHWGAGWLDAMVATNVSLTVMNYRTADEALQRGAEPFLAWGTRHKRQVTVALELGPIADETQWRFLRTQGRGELWALPLGRHTALVLFNRPVSELRGTAWQYQTSQAFSGGHVTFAGAPDRLNASVHRLLPTWSAWDGFRGIAIHGLDTAPQ